MTKVVHKMKLVKVLNIKGIFRRSLDIIESLRKKKILRKNMKKLIQIRK